MKTSLTLSIIYYMYLCNVSTETADNTENNDCRTKIGMPCCADLKKGHDRIPSSIFDSSCECCDGKGCVLGSDCSLCPQGHYLQDIPCTQCKHGMICNDTTSCSELKTVKACHPCRQGYYQPKTQQKECLKCPPGFQSLTSGSVLCVPCPRGHYKNESMTFCRPCPAGQEAVQEASTSCRPCLQGTHKSNESPLFCQPCTNGYYVLTTESLYCLQCPADFFCPCSKCGPVVCPEEAFCPKGSSSPIYCGNPLYRWVVDDCYVSTSLIGIIVAAILFSFLLLSVIMSKIYFRSQEDPPRNWNYLVEDYSTCSDPVYSGL